MRIKGRKPFLAWKSGLTGSGRKAVASHTGAMSGSEEIWRGVVKQAGIVPVEDLADIVDVAAAFYHLGIPRGRRLCVISGTAVNCADEAERNGLAMPELGAATVESLSGFLPGEGTGFCNPVDMGFGAVTPGNLSRVIKTVASDENVDLMMVVAGAPAAREGDPGLVRMHTEEIKEAVSEISKPVVVIGIPSGIAFGYMSELHWAGIPCYLSPGSACRSLSRFLAFHGI
jgi:acyl-CoA synthetase (NDP forming)